MFLGRKSTDFLIFSKESVMQHFKTIVSEKPPCCKSNWKVLGNRNFGQADLG